MTDDDLLQISYYTLRTLYVYESQLSPWFYCDACGDSIKKPKVLAHLNQCYTSSFTCIDCSRQFDPSSVAGHTQCVTEHDKYAKGATKPGGFAEKGFYEGGDGQEGGKKGSASISGEEFLSTRPPWSCSVCNVICTSRETLENHATDEQRNGAEEALQIDEDGQKKEKKKDGGKQKKKDGKKEKKGADQLRSKKKWKKKLTKQALKVLSKNGPEMRRKMFFAALEGIMEERGCDQEYVEKIINKYNPSIVFTTNKKVALKN
eukprot:jgi/Picsp_1/6749/NSC_04090-R1_protein